MIRNKKEDSKCVACASPNVKANTARKPTNVHVNLDCFSSEGVEINDIILHSFSVYVSYCILASFFSDYAETVIPVLSSSHSQMTSTITFTKLFTPDTGSWECDVCMVRNKKKDTKCVACASPNVKANTASKPSGDVLAAAAAERRLFSQEPSSSANQLSSGSTIGEGMKIPLLQGSTLMAFKLPSEPSSEKSSADITTTHPNTGPVVGGIKVPLLQSFTLKAPGTADISTPSLSSGDSGDGGMKIPLLLGTTLKGAVTASYQPTSEESSEDGQATVEPSQTTHSQQDTEESCQSSDIDQVHVSGEEINSLV